MNRRLVGLALVVALFVCGMAPGASAKPPRGFYGVTPQTDLTKKDFKLMGRAKVGTLRVNMSWGDLDFPPLTEADYYVEGPYRWWVFDPIVRRAAKQGIRVLPTVYGTPHWVGVFEGCPTACYKLGPTSIAGYIAFAQFMKAAAERYGTNGSFWRENPRLKKMPIRVWQIWNEQNSSDFWKPAPNPDHYANLVIAGGNAVHKADPRAKVILGGMIGEPGQAGKKTVSGWDFLHSLYANPEARQAFDGIAVHPYAASLRSIKRTIWRWREELRKAGAPKDPIWVTEIGWASGGGDHPLNRGPRGQAELITEAFKWFTQKRKALRIKNVDYYAWRDAPPKSVHCLWCKKSGLLKWRNHGKKPAWKAFTRFTKR